MVEWYEVIIPLASLVTAIVALATVYFLRKALKISEESHQESKRAYNDSRKAYEADMMMRFTERFHSDPVLKKVRIAIVRDKFLLVPKGVVTMEEFYRYLDGVNEIWILASTGVISEDLILQNFGALASEFGDSSEAMDFLKKEQENQGEMVWSGILGMIEKANKLYHDFKSKELKKKT